MKNQRSSAKRIASFLVAAATLGLASAHAIPQVTMGTFNAGSSGHYRADPNVELEHVLANYALGKSTDGTWFGTFCIERNEYFTPGDTYDVVLNNGSVNGGESGAVNGKDIISNATAYLYEQFAIGSLIGFVYGNATHAAQLQNTFWELEGETSGPDDFGSFLALAQSIANWSADYTGSAVKAMNLTQTKNGVTTLHQDQLVYLGHANVPDSGSSIALLFLGVAGLAAIRRQIARR